METAASLSKGGETYARVTLRRNLAGLLTINVWTLPHVEDFMKSLGDGTQVDCVLGGRHWVNLSKSEPVTPLLVWNMGTALPPIQISNERRTMISISGIGQPILGADANGFELVNMGFLRLVGSSQEGGVTIGVRGIHSTDQIARMRELVGEGLKRLYIGYMKPVNTTVMISAQTF